MSVGAPRERSNSEEGSVGFDYALKTVGWTKETLKTSRGTRETLDKVKKAAGIIAVVAVLVFAVLLTLALTVAATTFIAVPLAIAAPAVAVIALIVYTIAYCIKPKDAEVVYCIKPKDAEEGNNDQTQLFEKRNREIDAILADPENLASLEEFRRRLREHPLRANPSSDVADDL
jgi:hypothetical protein